MYKHIVVREQLIYEFQTSELPETRDIVCLPIKNKGFSYV